MKYVKGFKTRSFEDTGSLAKSISHSPSSGNVQCFLELGRKLNPPESACGGLWLDTQPKRQACAQNLISRNVSSRGKEGSVSKSANEPSSEH